ncbi:MAG: DUF5335 family protein [Usitatibacter sp.]
MSRQIPKAEWQAYFDSISETMAGSQVELEVASLGLGDQLEAEWVDFEGIAYDPAEDVIEFVLQDLDHRIDKPREIWLDETPHSLLGLEVVDAEGLRHILLLRAPLMLPTPDKAT